jgi:hypothetical protein
MPLSLVEMFNRVHDPRKAKGRIHDLTPLLCLAVVAILAGRTTLQGIAPFGRDHGTSLAHALGFRRGRTPCAATYCRVFGRLDIDGFEGVWGEWIVPRCPDLGEHFALDGNCWRGSHDGEIPAVHLPALFAPKVQAVVGPIRVDAKTNEHQAALRRLGIVPLRGKIVTGDAAVCQTEITEILVRAEADYLLHVKDHQPTVKERIAERLDPTAAFSPGPVTRRGREDGEDGGQGTWPDRESHGPEQRGVEYLVAGVGLREGPASDPGGTHPPDREIRDPRGGIRPNEFGPDAGGCVRAVAPDSGPLGDRESTPSCA